MRTETSKFDELNRIEDELVKMKSAKLLKKEIDEADALIKKIYRQGEEETSERYGVRNSRTRAQWANLVVDFGYEKICAFEKITPAQLRKILNKSSAEHLNEKFRTERLAKINGQKHGA